MCRLLHCKCEGEGLRFLPNRLLYKRAGRLNIREESLFLGVKLRQCEGLYFAKATGAEATERRLIKVLQGRGTGEGFL